jgi:flagellar motor switch protein FliN
MSQMIESFMQQAAGAALSARPIELDEAVAASSPAAGALLREIHPLHAVKVRLQVCVGETEMRVGELLAAREGELLVLRQPVHEPVDLLLEGKVVARGELVAVDGSFAVRITQLPLPLAL